MDIREWLCGDDYCEDYLTEYPEATSCIDCHYYESCFDRIEPDEDLWPWDSDWGDYWESKAVWDETYDEDEDDY